MENLQHILYKVRIEAIRGSTDLNIREIQTDSRKVREGDLFIALRGIVADGHRFIPDAVAAGASAIVCEEFPEKLEYGSTYLRVADSTTACAILASNFFDHPSEKLQLVGVTGTNGKTTVATLLYQLFTDLGYACGLISTVRNMVRDQPAPATHTTPDILSLNSLLSRMVSARCEYAFMEVSSHAIHQRRIAGLRFRGGIFTNITHDHLDYHGTFREYIRVKKSFFDGLPQTAFALTNADDRRGEVMLQNTRATKSSYSLRSAAPFQGNVLENNFSGLIMMIGGQEVHFRMIGEFNAYNLMAVYGAAVLSGQDSQQVLRVLSNLQGAEGRFDYILSPRERIVGIVDYAHTPDALLNVLSTIGKLKQGHEKVITVVGCGGDRDRTKRPLMAKIAAQHSDWLLITSDNPRSEDPLEIIHQMESGIPVAMKKKTQSLSDRREAIRKACSLASPEDIILVAGKGHEKYQEISGTRFDFDDRRVLAEAFEELGK
ncbi:MAG TPA: UDP-N-acetylmuramoyl-L-alanyl-D-glutamate--2,6-diaminopimelate ligase [Chitinophagaceae bacterium]|nr:UDP-N-acetylmuramoyl-L-alanyl-D-glutamate--2,6-diaminopimelate ligase [Chitinophagaceae bacterium]